MLPPRRLLTIAASCRHDIAPNTLPAMALSNALPGLVAVVCAKAPWRLVVKCCLASTVALVIALLPPFRARANFLTPMVTVFAHPGQRMGLMIQSLLMVLVGSLVGLSWSLLGLHLSGLVQSSNPPAAYTIRGLFLLVCVLVHGYVRSLSPRLLRAVLFLVIASLLTIQQPSTASASLFSTIYLPILLGAGVVLFVNLAVFPELSSSYLGSSTISTLSETIDTLAHAAHWFVTPGGDADGPGPDASTPDRGPAKQSFSHFPTLFRTAQNRPVLTSLPLHHTKLAHLTGQKSRLRGQLSRCKAAQSEVNFEVCLSPLPPSAMKPVSSQYMSDMVQNVLTLIGACENKLVVDSHDHRSDSSTIDEEPDVPTTPRNSEASQKFVSVASTDLARKMKKAHFSQVDSVRPVKELEASSAEFLESILAPLRGPVHEFQESLSEAANLVTLCLAYCFHVPRLPSGAPAPKGIPLEEMDLRIDHFSHALALFDFKAAEELKKAAMGQPGQSIDLLPGMETFLVSSFILAFRGSAAQLLEMLRHLRRLVEELQARNNRSRLWMPQYTSLRQWLATGGDVDVGPYHRKTKKTRRPSRSTRAASTSAETQVIPERDETDFRCTEPSGISPKQCSSRTGLGAAESKRPPGENQNHRRPGRLLRMRAKAAEAMEWAQGSDDLDYALKLAVAVFLVVWPALVASWTTWYADVRGIWAPMQLILVFEVTIGTSVFAFIIRLFGVAFGCIIGYLANQIGGGNRVVLVVVVLFGLVPSVYIQLATKYVKAGMVSIVSMSVVALGKLFAVESWFGEMLKLAYLAAVDGSTPAYEVFYKRLTAFLVGGFVAMLVEVGVAPVRARDRLVDSLSASVRQIQKMQAALAVGIDGPERSNFQSESLLARFSRSRDKAQSALAAAEAFLPFCLKEPRLKGSFKPLAPIYEEIIYVLHHITDRMDNVVRLRRAHGSSILEDLNPKVYAYQRNVAASSTLMLFLINEALTTWLPLPQFIPSARLAQLRLINRVCEILKSEGPGAYPGATETDTGTASLVTKRAFLSWSASAAGQMEMIEYLEELAELVKLLVGVNAFRSGMLERPTYSQYVGRVDAGREAAATAAAKEKEGGRLDPPEGGVQAGAPLTRAATVSQLADRLRGRGGEADAGGAGASASAAHDDGIPASLQRVGTRLRQDKTVVRRRAFTQGSRGA